MGETSTTTLEIITAVGSVVTPILILLLSSVILRFQRRADAAQRREEGQRERAQRLEEGMRADRIQIYNEILKPFIVMFSEVSESTNADTRRRTGGGRSNRGQRDMSAIEIMKSPAYREAAFKLTLFASDDVVKAYNELLQFAYQAENVTGAEAESGEPQQARTLQFLRTFGTLLLTIRRSVGNEGTTLHDVEMLEWLISDLRSILSDTGLNET